MSALETVQALLAEQNGLWRSLVKRHDGMDMDHDDNKASSGSAAPSVMTERASTKTRDSGGLGVAVGRHVEALRFRQQRIAERVLSPVTR